MNGIVFVKRLTVTFNKHQWRGKPRNLYTVYKGAFSTEYGFGWLYDIKSPEAMLSGNAPYLACVRCAVFLSDSICNVMIANNCNLSWFMIYLEQRRGTLWRGAFWDLGQTSRPWMGRRPSCYRWTPHPRICRIIQITRSMIHSYVGKVGRRWSTSTTASNPR